jgi:hypothetical protein
MRDVSLIIKSLRIKSLRDFINGGFAAGKRLQLENQMLRLSGMAGSVFVLEAGTVCRGTAP